MDAHDMLKVIRVLQNTVGDVKLLEALETVTYSKTDFDPEDIADQASDCTEMDEREWYSIATDNGYGGYIDSGEHASELILDNLRDAFEKELRQIVLTGNKGQASKYLRAIADGLRQASGILTEETEDFINDFTEELERRAEEKEFDDIFEW
ncbi:MAG: hypothetical protein MJZ21_01900 [archaeon]|nr:hypothetical protein [archaeon]